MAYKPHQAVLNSSQNVLYALRPQARNRINSAFMTSFFLGGAVGSALTSMVWVSGGWTGVCILGATFSAGTIVLWGLERITVNRAERKPSRPQFTKVGHHPRRW